MGNLVVLASNVYSCCFEMTVPAVVVEELKREENQKYFVVVFRFSDVITVQSSNLFFSAILTVSESEKEIASKHSWISLSYINLLKYTHCSCMSTILKDLSHTQARR